MNLSLHASQRSSMAGIHYHKLSLASSGFLSETVHAIYSIESSASAVNYQAVPNGFIGLTLILDGHSTTEQCNTENNRAWVIGLITRPLSVFHAPHSKEITVVFNPVMLKCFVKIPMRLLANGFAIAAEDLFPKQPLKDLMEQLYHDSSDTNVVRCVENFLIELYSETIHHRQALRMYEAIQQLYVNEVGDLANTFGVSTTTLRNWSADFVGLSPKELIQIRRFQGVLKEQEVQSLTDLAYRFQYFDQAHFTKNFRKLSGMSPSRYFSNNKLAFDFYKYGRWMLDSFAEN